MKYHPLSFFALALSDLCGLTFSEIAEQQGTPLTAGTDPDQYFELQNAMADPVCSGICHFPASMFITSLIRDGMKIASYTQGANGIDCIALQSERAAVGGCWADNTEMRHSFCTICDVMSE